MAILLAVCIIAAAALPCAAAQRTIAAPEGEYIPPKGALRLVGQDTWAAIGTILSNTGSQFVTGNADTGEIDRLFASLPLLREEDLLPRLTDLGTPLDVADELRRGMRGIRLVLLETQQPDIYRLGIEYTDLLGRPRQSFDLLGEIEYDRAAGVFQNLDGWGCFNIGFDYDAAQHTVFAAPNQWILHWLGYNPLYDALAPLLIIYLDTCRIPFSYGGEDWQVQLWKGRYFYAFHGAEIGLYKKPIGYSAPHYVGAKDTMLPMSMELYHDEELLFSFDEKIRWWLTGFQYGNLFRTIYSHDELRLVGTITFEDPAMLEAFWKAFQADTPKGVTGSVEGLTFRFEW